MQACVPGAILQPQLLPSRTTSRPPPFQLLPAHHGGLDGLRPTPLLAVPSLAPGEVLVAVSAVGLNFRDVLNVLGMYPGDPGAPGETIPCHVIIVPKSGPSAPYSVQILASLVAM